MKNTITLLSAVDNKTMLYILMFVLIAFIALLLVLGIVFITALRKRAPVVKVIMAPPADDTDEPEDEEEPFVYNPEPVPAPAPAPAAQEEPAPVEKREVTNVIEYYEPVIPKKPEPEPEFDEDDGDEAVFVTEGQERVRYDRSMTAKLAQLNNESKEWYTELKNELLAYERIKDRMSWKRESFRYGRMTLARLVVRGKTLCLLVAVEPAGYQGTKFSVEDVSNVASTADTPTQYRIKSKRRLKYAKELLAGMMKELKIYKDPRYEAKDFFIPYEGNMSLMQRGLVKRIVTGTNKVYKIEAVDSVEVAANPAPAPELQEPAAATLTVKVTPAADEPSAEKSAGDTAKEEVAATEAPAKKRSKGKIE